LADTKIKGKKGKKGKNDPEKAFTLSTKRFVLLRQSTSRYQGGGKTRGIQNSHRGTRRSAGLKKLVKSENSGQSAGVGSKRKEMGKKVKKSPRTKGKKSIKKICPWGEKSEHENAVGVNGGGVKRREKN